MNAKYCLEDCDIYLGILDIPGLKNSKKGNNLEQFLFNFSNEKIRTYTNIRIWTASQVHGHNEGIVTEEGSSIDNSIVELISSSGTGILAMIDSETVRVQTQGGQDKADGRLVDRLNDRFSKTPNFKSAKIVKKKKEVTATLFTIAHYGDTQIEYNVLGFVSRNSDALSTDLVSLFRGNDELPASSNSFIRSLFSDEVVSTQVLDTNKDIVTSAQITSNPTRKPSTKKKRDKDGVEEEPIIEIPGNTTLLSKFTNSLDELCTALTDAETWVLICLLRQSLPKNDKSWDGALVRKQVVFHGITSLGKYQAACPYPVSYRFPLFIEKFKGFFKAGANPALAVMDPREVCQQFSQEFSWGPREVAIGSTEIFVTQSNWTKLHERLERGTKKSFAAFRPLSDKSGDYAESSFSGDESEAFSDFVDDEPEEQQQPDIERGLHFVPFIDDKEPERPDVTPARKRWVCCTWCLTWYMPVRSPCKDDFTPILNFEEFLPLYLRRHEAQRHPDGIPRKSSLKHTDLFCLRHSPFLYCHLWSTYLSKTRSYLKF